MPRSASGKPVERSGSANAAADGRSAQPGPAARSTRNGSRGAWTKGSVGRPFRTGPGSSENARAGASSAASPRAKPTASAKASEAATPALVRPLLNLRIQIQPPGKTWCTAASSTGYGGISGPPGIPISSSRRTPSKCVKRPCVGGRNGSDAAHAQRIVKRAASSRGVHEESGAKRDPLSAPARVDAKSPAFEGGALDPRLVEVFHSRIARLLDEEGVEIRAVPVRVGDLVVRARGDEELVLPVRGVRERPSLRAVEEAEPALQAAAHLRVCAPPGAPLRERQEAGKRIARGELLEQEVRERRRGLADREARMRAFFEKKDGEAEPSRHEREERAGEAGPDDRDVEGAPCTCLARLLGRQVVPARRAERKREISLNEVHFAEPVHASRGAAGWGGQRVGIPEIREDEPRRAGAPLFTF